MAREPVKLNAPVSAAGQVSNRAAYMRPANDRSGSKALAEALGSLSGSLTQFNQQVDRFQNAQRQSELEQATKVANEKKQQLYLEGLNAGPDGDARAASLQDSPLFHQAYQEGRMIAEYDRTVATMERETDWTAFNNDVDDGHNKLQAFLLDSGEQMMAGYSPELQARMLTQYREYSNKKMLQQSLAAKQKREENMVEDLAISLESSLVTSGNPEELRALMSEAGTILAKAGVDNPSGKVGDALITAATLTRDPDAIDRVLSDPDFAKTLNTDTRTRLASARDQLAAQEAAIENRERAEYNRAFNDTTAMATMEALQMSQGGNVRGAIDTIDGALATAYSHPDESVALSAVNSLSTIKKALLAPPPEVKMSKGEELSQRMALTKELSLLAAQGASDLELQAAAAPYMERGISTSQALSSIGVAVRFAEERTDSFSTAFNNNLKVITGEISGAANTITDASAFLPLRETDIDQSLIANSMKFHYFEIINEEEQTLAAQHGDGWEAKVGYEEMGRIHKEAARRAAEFTIQDPDSGFVALLNEPSARARLLGSPTARAFLIDGLGKEEVARLDGLNTDARASSEAAVEKARNKYDN